MSKDAPLEGGCHCGAVRYQASAKPTESVYCHCRDCQRSTGAPVLAWTELAATGFEFVQGEPAVYRSSSSARREFCAACGTQILFRIDPPSTDVYVNVGTLDEPGRVEPTHHTWCASRIGWFEIADDLPRFEREAP